MERLVKLLNEVIEIAESMKCCLSDGKSKELQLSDLNPGDVFLIGEHEFIVLERFPEGSIVISKELWLKNVAFDSSTRDYAKSGIKKNIEEKIQSEIEKAVGKENLIEHYVSLKSLDGQREFEDVCCKVRPITFDEARKYNNFLVNKELQDWWWTCTPWSTKERGYSKSMLVVSPSGLVSNRSCYDCSGVRPVCILKSNIFVSKKGE